MPRLLIATDNSFWLQSMGSERRIADLCRYLTAKGMEVLVFHTGYLAPQTLALIGRDFPGLQMAGNPRYIETPLVVFRLVRALVRTTLSLPARLLRRSPSIAPLLDRAGSRPRSLRDHRSWRLRHRFETACRRFRPDFVLVEYIRLGYLIEKAGRYLSAESQLLIDTIDVMHERASRYSERSLSHPISIDETEETEALQRFDLILAIQSRDARIFKGLAPRTPVITVGYAHPCVAMPRRSHDGVVLCLMGGPDHANARAVRTFAQEVWPKLSTEASQGARARIYGRVCDLLTDEPLPEGIELVGFVEDPALPFRECDILVNLVDIGGGLKIKNVEALCHGMPLLTTTIGAEGLEDGIDTAFVVADTVPAAHRALSELITDPDKRRQLSERALAYARSRFSDEASYGELWQYLQNPSPKTSTDTRA